MLKKIIIMIFITFLISQAGEFIKYDRALRIIPGYTQEGDDMKGAAISFNYIQRAGKTLFDFSITPKWVYWSEASYNNNEYGNSSISFSDTTFDDYNYEFSSQQKIVLGAAILFSHRPSIRAREGAGALTFNFWRYGLTYDWEIYKKYRYEVDEWERESIKKSKDLEKCIGWTYNPLMGVQITDRINLSIELTYTWCLELDETIWLYPKFGSGLSFTFSNPVKSF